MFNLIRIRFDFFNKNNKNLNKMFTWIACTDNEQHWHKRKKNLEQFSWNLKPDLFFRKKKGSKSLNC